MPAIVVGAVVGCRQHKRTLERPGRRSHAGAWERSPSESPVAKRNAGPAREGGAGHGVFLGKKTALWR